MSERDEEAILKLHNQAVNDVVQHVCNSTFELGGTMSDVWAIVESVVLGFVMVSERLGYNGREALKVLNERVAERHDEMLQKRKEKAQ